MVLRSLLALAFGMVLARGQNIVQVLAQSSPDHTYLVAGVVANELVDVLSDATQTHTVFAPTNDAFPENFEKTDANKNTLLNHVLATKVSSTDLNACQIVDTVGGKKIKVTKNADGVVMVNNAKVVTADLEATNGVVHSINAVIEFTGDYENPSCPTSNSPVTQPETSRGTSQFLSTVGAL